MNHNCPNMISRKNLMYNISTNYHSKRVARNICKTSNLCCEFLMQINAIKPDIVPIIPTTYTSDDGTIYYVYTLTNPYVSYTLQNILPIYKTDNFGCMLVGGGGGGGFPDNIYGHTPSGGCGGGICSIQGIINTNNNGYNTYTIKVGAGGKGQTLTTPSTSGLNTTLVQPNNIKLVAYGGPAGTNTTSFPTIKPYIFTSSFVSYNTDINNIYTIYGGIGGQVYHNNYGNGENIICPTITVNNVPNIAWFNVGGGGGGGRSDYNKVEWGGGKGGNGYLGGRQGIPFETTSVISSDGQTFGNGGGVGAYNIVNNTCNDFIGQSGGNGYSGRAIIFIRYSPIEKLKIYYS